MTDGLRKTGLDVIGDVPWGTHFCQFYQSPQDLLDILVPYFKAGLENNEFCMWVTSEPLGAEAARAALAAAVPDLDRRIERGQIEIIPHTDWYLRDGVFDADRVLDGWVRKLEAAQASGFAGLRLTGNTFWLEPKDWRVFTDYEASVDGVIGRYRMLAVCTYSIDRCGFTEILDVVRNHRFALVRREGRWELVESGESRRAVDALEKSEQRFRSLFESMTEGFALHEIVVDGRGRPVDYRFLDINPAFEKLTGLRRDETLGRTVKEVLPGIEPFWIETYGRVALSGEPATFERHYAAPLDRTYQIYAYRPAPGQFAVLFIDVTARKKTEAALQASHEELEVAAEELRQQNDELLHVQSALLDSEERHRLLHDTMFMGVVYQNADGAIISMNPAAERILGKSPQDFLGQTSVSVEHDSIREDGRTFPGVDHPSMTALRTGKEVRGVVMGVYNPRERRYRWIVIDAIPVFKPGEKTPGRVYTIFEDVTERRRTEELGRALEEQERLRLGAAVEQASDAVIMIDLDGTIRYVNAAFESLNDVARGEAIGRSYFGFLAAQSPSLDALRAAVAQGRPWQGPLAGTVRGGRPVELSVTVSAVTNPAGAVIGGLITEKDVTNENALQRQVRQAQKMEALGTLAGGITHDFNNILGAIIINTELALLDLENAHPARKPLPLVLQAANRGKELVKQIITFSRQREWERKPIEIAPAVKEALRFLRATLSKEIAIRETVADGCGTILADPSHIHQIMVNLCQNAALAMQDGPGTLEIRLEPLEADASLVARHPELKPGPYVRLTVSDTGCGIERQHLERIFEPFFTTRGPGRGSGLGLAVVHGIVKSYEGAIAVYSEPGKGSVFTVYLPRLEGEGGTEPEAHPPKPLEGRERILLVDDEETQRSSLALGLKRLGYGVTPRAGGRAALSLFRKDPAAFDVVITDQTMPRMSGLELAAEMVRLRPGLPVILCTGFSEKVNGSVIGRSGVRAFIMKPFTLQEITRLIRETVENKSAPPAAK